MTSRLWTLEQVDINPFLSTEICTFVITSLSFIVSKPLQTAKRIFSRFRALLSGRDVTRVRHDAMGVASWRAGSSLPLRYQNGLSGRERRLIFASSTCMTLLSTLSMEGMVSRSICPAGLRGALRSFSPPAKMLGQGRSTWLDEDQARGGRWGGGLWRPWRGCGIMGAFVAPQHFLGNGLEFLRRNELLAPRIESSPFRSRTDTCTSWQVTAIRSHFQHIGRR